MRCCLRFQNRSHLHFLVEVNSRAELYHAQRHRNQIKRNTHGLIEIRGCYSAYCKAQYCNYYCGVGSLLDYGAVALVRALYVHFSESFFIFQSKNKSHALKQHSRCKSAEKASVQRGNFLIAIS